MKKILLIALVFVFFASLHASEPKKLVWPFIGEAEIEYISSVRTLEDFGIKKGFFTKVYEFIFGEDNPILSNPFGIHADKNRVYVTDISMNKLFIFDKKENEVITISGAGDEYFAYPIDVLADSKGNIYVSDSVRAKIYVFKENGKYNYTISSKLFQRPVGLSLSPDEKRLYIVDSMASQIHVTTPNGEYIKTIGKRGIENGEFNKPTFMCVDKYGKLFISDTMNHRIQILDREGGFIHKFGRIGRNISDFANPRGIGLDDEGNIYVGDALFNRIQIFNQSGELLMLFGGYGNERGKFSLPEDISIVDNMIHIADTSNERYQVFKRLTKVEKGSSK